MKKYTRRILLAVLYFAICKMLFLSIVSFMSANEKYEAKKEQVKNKIHKKFTKLKK